MSVHFDSKNLEMMEKGLERLKKRNHGSYDEKEIVRALSKIKMYRRLFDVK